MFDKELSVGDKVLWIWSNQSSTTIYKTEAEISEIIYLRKDGKPRVYPKVMFKDYKWGGIEQTNCLIKL